MANRQGDVNLPFAQVTAPELELWLGLAWTVQSLYYCHIQNSETTHFRYGT